MKDLVKKHKEEFDRILKGYLILTDGEYTISKPRKKLEDLIKKIHKETAEKVCDKMIGYFRAVGKSDEDEYYVANSEYNHRIKEEKEIKKQILEEL